MKIIEHLIVISILLALVFSYRFGDGSTQQYVCNQVEQGTLCHWTTFRETYNLDIFIGMIVVGVYILLSRKMKHNPLWYVTEAVIIYWRLLIAPIILLNEFKKIMLKE